MQYRLLSKPWQLNFTQRLFTNILPSISVKTKQLLKLSKKTPKQHKVLKYMSAWWNKFYRFTIIIKDLRLIWFAHFRQNFAKFILLIVTRLILLKDWTVPHIIWKILIIMKFPTRIRNRPWCSKTYSTRSQTTISSPIRRTKWSTHITLTSPFCTQMLWW